MKVGRSTETVRLKVSALLTPLNWPLSVYRLPVTQALSIPQLDLVTSSAKSAEMPNTLRLAYLRTASAPLAHTKSRRPKPLLPPARVVLRWSPLTVSNASWELQNCGCAHE